MSDMIVYRTGKLADTKVIELIDAINHEMEMTHGTINLAGRITIDYTKGEHEGIFTSNDLMIISGADLHIGNQRIIVQFRRGIGRDSTNMDAQREASSYFDEIAMKPNKSPREPADQASPKELIKCASIIKNFLVTVVPQHVEDGAGTALDLLQSQISSLSALFDERIRELETRRSSLEAEYESKFKVLEENFREKSVSLESEADNIRQELETKSKEIDSVRKELDDRNHMHVRRDLREQITEEVKNKLRSRIVSPSAWRIRFAVSTISFLAAVFLGYIAYISFGEVAKDDPSPMDTLEWMLFGRGMLASLGSVAFIVYAISWLRSIYLDDIRAARELERYGFDINRASWSIETIMEMSAQEGSGPPEAWIDGVCRNLFESNLSNKREGPTPLEALGTVLGVSARAKFGPEGPEFEVSRSGAKKLAKGSE